MLNTWTQVTSIRTYRDTLHFNMYFTLHMYFSIIAAHLSLFSH
jgi:hypothetical protein